MKITEKAEWILSNVAYVAVLWANIVEILPWFVGIIGGLALSWYNIERAINERHKRKGK
jgi:hypothetical protein